MTTRQQAQEHLEGLKKAIIDYVKQNKKVTNTEITRALGLESDMFGEQKNYLAWSILGILISEKKVITLKEGRARYFMTPE